MHPNPIFQLIARVGNVERAEMEKTFNMGVGMVAVVSEEDAERALAMLTARHVEAWKLGTVSTSDEGDLSGAILGGEYPPA